MRKLALLLGSLLVVASASAKEVVPAPVVVEEAPVQVIEKEVIVYRDKEEGFRPNGFVDLQYRYYGETETQDGTDWNGNNKYGRLQLQGKINMTEKQALEYRVRDFNKFTSKNSKVGGKTGDDTRLRYTYNHGLLGDSKVDFTSRVEARDNNNARHLEYQARFNFAEYMFNNDFVKTTNFVVAPKYRHVFADEDDYSDTYDNQLGVDLYTMHELPWGFSFEFNLYATQHFYGADQIVNGKIRNGEATWDEKDKNFTVDVEAYIYNTTNLYTNGKVSVDFNFEGGYDTYSWAKEKAFLNKSETSQKHAAYQLYALPTIQVNYQATPSVKVYAAAGAEYRNWNITAESEASNWRWQPTVFAGFRASF